MTRRSAMCVLVCGALLATLGAGRATTQESAGAAEVQVIALAINKSPDQMRTIASAFGFIGGGEYRGGTVVVANVTSPEPILQVDPMPRISKFTDDLGRDLGNGAGAVSPGESRHLQTGMGEDGKSCTFWLKSEKTPQAGAHEIRITGNLPMKIGAGEKVVSLKGQPLTLGSTLTADGITMTVSGLSAQWEGGSDRGMITVSSQQALERVKEVELTDETGKPIAAQWNPYPGNGRQGEKQASIIISRSVKRADVKVVLFQKIETVDVPLDMHVRVGF